MQSGLRKTGIIGPVVLLIPIPDCCVVDVDIALFVVVSLVAYFTGKLSELQ